MPQFGAGHPPSARTEDYGACRRWLAGRARTVARTDELVEDLVQDTFVALLERPPTLRTGLRPWLDGVMRNRFRMWSRTSARRERRESAVPAESAETELRPDGRLERARLEALVARALEALPDPYRSTLRLRYWEDLRPVDIAKRLGVPEGTVRRRCLVGLSMLRVELAALIGGDPDEVESVLLRAFAVPGWLGARALGEVVRASARGLLGRVPVLAVAGVAVVLALLPPDAAPSRSVSVAHELPGWTRAEGTFARAARFDLTRAEASDEPGPSSAAIPTGDGEAAGDGEDFSEGAAGRARLADRCGSLSARIAHAAPGAVVRVPGGCVFREGVVIDKPLVLEGEQGAEIRGSDVFAAWGEDSGLWRSRAVVPRFRQHDCAPTPAGDNSNDLVCAGFELVFMDGAPLRRTDGVPGPGEFALDEGRHVLLGEPPAGHLVEVAVRSSWIEVQASHVTVRGLGLRHAMGGPEAGGIVVATGTSHVSIERNHLASTGGPGMSVGGRDHTIVGNEITGAGGPGLWIDGEGYGAMVVRGNHLHGNGLAHRFDNGWITGGVKAIGAMVLLEDNRIEDNRGSGVQFAGCRQARLVRNRVHDNLGAGVVVLLSHDVEIANNRMWRNGAGVTPVQPAVLVVQSTGTRVLGNALAHHPAGVSIGPLELDGTLLPDGYDSCAASRYNHVEANVVVVDRNDPGVRLVGDPRPGFDAVAPCATNRSVANGVWTPVRTIAPAVAGVRVLSTEERDELLARAGVEAAPL